MAAENDFSHAFLDFDTDKAYAVVRMPRRVQHSVPQKKLLFFNDYSVPAGTREEFSLCYFVILIRNGEIWFAEHKECFALDNVLNNKALEYSFQGYSFLLAGIEVVDTYVFEGQPKPNWIGLDTMWDIASMAETGRRVLFNRTAHPHGLVIEWATKLNRIMAAIKGMQAPNRELNLELFRAAERKAPADEIEAIKRRLKDSYPPNSLTPPDFLF